MSGFLYFVPGPNVPTAQSIASRFAHHQEADLPGRPTTTGPGGEAGHIFTLTSPKMRGGCGPKRLGWYEDGTQVWKPIPGSDLWIGTVTADPPTPQDLARRSALEGMLVELNDGNKWCVPMVKRWPDGAIGACIETAYSLTTDGRIAFEKPTAAYDRLWARITKLWKAIPKDSPERNMTDEEGFLLCCDVLGLNYRLGPAEVAALNLITTRNMTDIFCVMCDIRAEER